MKKIALLTDSCCDLSMKDIERYNIFMVPVRVIYKEQEFLDKIEISPDEMYERLHDEVPTTSLPALEYTTKVFEDIISKGYEEVLVVSVSSALTGTMNSIRLMSEGFKQLKFTFFDTKTLGFPQGAIVLEAVRLLQEVDSIDEVVSQLEDVRRRTVGYVAVDTLEYLEKGGRLSHTAAKIGTLLKLKPIIRNTEDGELECFEKVRGRKQAIARLKKYVEEKIVDGKYRVWILEGSSREDAIKLFQDLEVNTNIKQIAIEKIGAAMGVHTGPGALGVCIQEIG